MVTIDLALSLLIATISHASEISALIQKAQAEKRDLTAAELQTLMDTDAVSRSALVAAIAAAK
jgi:hypothetical protein